MQELEKEEFETITDKFLNYFKCYVEFLKTPKVHSVYNTV